MFVDKQFCPAHWRNDIAREQARHACEGGFQIGHAAAEDDGVGIQKVDDERARAGQIVHIGIKGRLRFPVTGGCGFLDAFRAAGPFTFPCRRQSRTAQEALKASLVSTEAARGIGNSS